MNPTHIHLVLNHFPIVGGIIGMAMLLWGTVSKNISLQKISALVLIIMAILAIPVFLTGESAEHTIESMPGISESLIEAHEDAAKVSFWLMMTTGTIALTTLFLKLKKYNLSGTFFLVTLVASVVSTASMAYAGYTGGQIRHTEISGTQVAQGESGVEQGEEE